MKDHERREFISQLHLVAKTHSSTQCLREALARVVNKYIPKESTK